MVQYQQYGTVPRVRYSTNINVQYQHYVWYITNSMVQYQHYVWYSTNSIYGTVPTV